MSVAAEIAVKVREQELSVEEHRDLLHKAFEDLEREHEANGQAFNDLHRELREARLELINLRMQTGWKGGAT